MEINPLSIILTLLGGLALAGILGWIRRSRLVVFVPRLFSHSNISDRGQIVEISVMNRGFKTEESIDLSLNPQLHYELIGSNNPDAYLSKGRLSIPRIGSADDCSVLLQVENGTFTYQDIVSCLSKETKGVVKTKLEEIPVTAHQRVGILVFIGFLALIATLGYKSLDLVFGGPTETPAGSRSEESPRPDLQGWRVSETYKSYKIYKQFVDKKLIVNVGKPTVRKAVASFPLTVSNSTEAPITFTGWISAAVPQDDIDPGKRRIQDRLIFPKGSAEYTLLAAISQNRNEHQVQLEFFLRGSDGETLSGSKLVSLE